MFTVIFCEKYLCSDGSTIIQPPKSQSVVYMTPLDFPHLKFLGRMLFFPLLLILIIIITDKIITGGANRSQRND